MAIVDCENEETKLRLKNAQELLGSYLNSQVTMKLHPELHKWFY